ncbi:MAG: DNA-protecting protein DprA [Ruminiclostridium sp.]|nr:DNA-protecting protein DprA [Ruminiclostridium sp.]
MNENRDRYNIWLTMLLGTANPKIHKINERYGSPKKAYEAITSGDQYTLSDNERTALSYVTIDKADDVLDKCAKMNVSVCSLGSKEYPKLLAEIYDPPAVFFYRGDLSCLDVLSLTFVGAREASPYIIRLCSRISRDIGMLDITLVSGMARGVDQAVHRTCVANHLRTVGVLACGIDYDYPAGSKILREKMVINGGAYLTELMPGTPPSKEYFNPRNRILAGLTRGTAVFQASVTSGSLVTASYAADENRDVFCVPPPDIFDPMYEGVKSFIDDGAIPIFNHNDILKEYVGLYI